MLTISVGRTRTLLPEGAAPITSAPVRDPLADHLLTPQNAALLLIDYQPSQLAGVRSMDRDLLVKNAVSTLRTIKTFGVPVVHSTINDAGTGCICGSARNAVTSDAVTTLRAGTPPRTSAWPGTRYPVVRTGRGLVLVL